ncbi:unnamed protein product [Musa acuminata subsp. burmannicoides]
MVAMVLKARMRLRSGLAPRLCHRPREEERNSACAPLGLEMTVERPPSVRRGLVGPPTRTGSLSADSLAKVRHSEVTSMECASSTSPHSEHTVSPAEWSNTTSVLRLQSGQKASAIKPKSLSPPTFSSSSIPPTRYLSLVRPLFPRFRPRSQLFGEQLRVGRRSKSQKQLQTTNRI